MDKQIVLDRLCALATKVGAKFNHSNAHDCFCTPNNHISFQFDEKILAFIESAVKLALDNYRTPKT